MKDKKDALGNQIILGQKYGYAANRNGHNSVIVGFARNFTEKGVTLTVISHKKSIYADDLKDAKPIKSVNCKSMMLFPVFSDEDFACPKCGI